MALSCGPKCHAEEAKVQSRQALHFAAVAREGCDQRTSVACLTSCLVSNLLSERYLELGMGQDQDEDEVLVDALEATIGKKQKHGDRWFVSNLTDPLVFVMNATLSDPVAAQARKERLDEFWGDLCSKLHEGKSRHRKDLCPHSKDSVDIHFDYLDQLKDQEEAQKRLNVLESQASPSVGFLQLSPDDYLAEVARHTPKRVAMKALKKASGFTGKIEGLRVKKFLEVGFLREKKRAFQCSHPALLVKLLASGSTLA